MMLFVQIFFIFHYFFYIFAFCATSADLVPPFLQNNDGFIGNWQLFGAAQVLDENEIMIVPPLQYSKGGVWTSLEIPRIDFQIKYEICITEGTGGGGFAIWFSNEYGTSGQLNGGPSLFKGIALLCSICNEGTKINFHLLQNNGNDQYHLNSLPSPDFVMKINSNDNITFSFQIKEGFIKIYSFNLNREIISKEMVVSIDNNYMGVTAQSDILTSKINANLIEMQFSNFMNERKVNHIFSDIKNSIHYDPDFVHTLRNPYFSSTTLEIEKMQEGINNKEQASISHLLSIIDESNFASYEVASFKELNKFISKSLIPFTQKWHKRTVKIVEESYNLRNAFNLAWNHTQNIMKTFNATVKKNIMKTKFKILDLEDILIDQSNNSYIDDEIKEDISFKIKYSPIIIILLVISIIEIFAVGLLFIFMNNPKLHNKVKATVD